MGFVTYDSESFQNKALELAGTLGVAAIKGQSPNIITLCLAMNIYLARLVFFEQDKLIGISFAADANPEDVIHTYMAASKLISGLRMLASFYIDGQGREFLGPDAFAAKEMDLERAISSVIMRKLEEDDKHYMNYVRFVSREPHVVSKESHDTPRVNTLVRQLVKR